MKPIRSILFGFTAVVGFELNSPDTARAARGRKITLAIVPR
jgi:hypothetical protein